MLNQVFAITALNLKSLGSRLGLSAVIVVGTAGVVAVLCALLAMSQGFQKTLAATGRADRAIVLRGGSSAELNSALSRDQAAQIKQVPGVQLSKSGKPLASTEMIVITEFASKARGGSFNVSLRGLEPEGLEMRPELRIVEGRMFEAGLKEVIVGKGALAQFEGVTMGSALRFRGADWTVVGVFESGDAHESELLADLGTAQTAFNRQGASSVLLKLENKDALAAVKKTYQDNPQLAVDVQSELDYYSGQTKNFRQLIGVLALVVSAIMAIGALFASLNTMFAAVAARTRQIATLRAVGFGGFPVASAVLIEAMLLAALGGILGALIAYLLFNNLAVSTLGAGFTQVVFNFKVTPALIATGVIIALIIGFVGGFFPALRAARLKVTDALRAG
jgi:putative ABC transport system permease protein